MTDEARDLELRMNALELERPTTEAGVADLNRRIDELKKDYEATGKGHFCTVLHRNLDPNTGELCVGNIPLWPVK